MNSTPPIAAPSEDFPIPLPELLDRVLPGAEYRLSGNSYDGLDWHDPRPCPSFEDLAAVLGQMLTAGEDTPDWDALTSELAELIGFAMATTNGNAFALLNSTLTSYRNPALLLTSLQQIKAGMPEGTQMFPETIKFVNQALARCGFDLSI
jgi:hypothetical protein